MNLLTQQQKVVIGLASPSSNPSESIVCDVDSSLRSPVKMPAFLMLDMISTCSPHVAHVPKIMRSYLLTE